MTDVRAVCLDCLLKIEKGEFCHLVLRNALEAHGDWDRRDRAFSHQAGTEGCVEHRYELDAILDSYSRAKNEEDEAGDPERAAHGGISDEIYGQRPRPGGGKRSCPAGEKKGLFVLTGVCKRCSQNRFQRTSGLESAGRIGKLYRVGKSGMFDAGLDHGGNAGRRWKKHGRQPCFGKA